MEQNDSAEEVKETKNDEEIGWDDVQDEMKASAKPAEKKEVNSVTFEEGVVRFPYVRLNERCFY